MLLPASLRLTRSGGLEAATVGVIGGATAAVIVLAANNIADVGDLLGFVGSAVGAGLAVIGAVYVEGRKRTDERTIATDNVIAILEGYVKFVDFTISEIDNLLQVGKLGLILEMVADRLESVMRYVGPKISQYAVHPDVIHCGYWLEIDGKPVSERLRTMKTETHEGESFRRIAVDQINSSKRLAEVVLIALRKR